MLKFKLWMTLATTHEKEHLARACGLKLSSLYSFASGHRRVSALLADKIARATLVLAADNPKLPLLLRGDLNKTCRECPHYKACVKGKE